MKGCCSPHGVMLHGPFWCSPTLKLHNPPGGGKGGKCWKKVSCSCLWVGWGSSALAGIGGKQQGFIFSLYHKFLRAQWKRNERNGKKHVKQWTLCDCICCQGASSILELQYLRTPIGMYSRYREREGAVSEVKWYLHWRAVVWTLSSFIISGGQNLSGPSHGSGPNRKGYLKPITHVWLFKAYGDNLYTCKPISGAIQCCS